MDFGGRIDWRSAQKPLLWRFHLHYFDWAPECDISLLKEQIASWIESNPPGSWPGWHPYPTSLRIVNWIRACCRNPELPAETGVLESLAAQAGFLELNLEYHLGGNHLLENAHALLAAGLYFEGGCAARWKAIGLETLCCELPEQVLPDGGHFERSPWYHLRMNRLVNDSIALLAGNGCAIPPELTSAAGKMTTFSEGLRHQDGRLPLFHDALDSEVGRPPVPQSASASSFPSTGYYILDTGAGRLIADYGAPAGCYNPAHQHAGIFSYEVSSGPHRVIVDSGTPTYDRGPERDALRGTAAHNTVRVDGLDQFQVWDRFRVGRRAQVLEVEERRGEGYHSISAIHDGYRRLGIAHRRTIVSLPVAGWLVIDDLIGRGSHRLESFVHLGPEIIPVIEDHRVCLQPLCWALLLFGSLAATESAGIHSPALGVRETSRVIALDGIVHLPCRCGYFLGPSGWNLAADGDGGIRIQSATCNIGILPGPIGGADIEVSYNWRDRGH